MEIPKYKARKVFREPTRTAKLKRWYQGQLFKVTDVIGDIVDDIASRYEPLIAAGKIEAILTEYSATLTDWAVSTAGRMVTEASNADYAVWLSVGKKISKATRQLLKESGKGDVFNKLQNEQVTLIKSLPLEASEKVHEWVKEGLSKGDRYDDITKRIRVELKPLVKHRAECIARTETARARSNFTQARAKNIGSPGYIWKTVGDSRVRPMHADLNGKFIPWELPPVTDFGRGGTPIHAHAGCVFNCFTGDTLVRIPDDLLKVIRAPFNGRIIEMRTAFGLVTATPNHPMFTQRGWIPASEIREGDYFLQPFCDTVQMVEPDKDRGIARLDELFNSVLGERVRTPGVEFDFYGDIPCGDVDTAIVKGGLSANFVAKCRKRFRDFMLARPDAVMIGVSHDVSNMGASGFLGKRPALIKGHSSHTNNIGFGIATDGDIAFFKAIVNSASGNSKSFGKSQNTFPGLISADDLAIVKIEPINGDSVESAFEGINSKRSKPFRKMIGGNINSNGCISDSRAILYKGFCVKNLRFRNYFGHVYTLETVKGWYGVTPFNYTTKNCRCWAMPIFPDEIKGKEK